MGIKLIQVDESQKDDPDVQETTAPVLIGGNMVQATMYVRSVLHDDLNKEVTEGVLPVELLVPSLGDEEYETGEKNDDGTAKLAVRPCVKYARLEVHLGRDNFELLQKNLQEALQPFMDVSRPVEIPEQPKRRGRRPKATQAAPSAE